MGSTHFLSPHSFYHLFSNPNKPLQNPNFSSNFCCSSSSRPNWSSNSDASQRRRFEFEEEFGRREKRRNWWSDDDDEDDDEEEFGFWEEQPTAIDWFFKIAKAFGWMIPIVLLSTVLGTGSNSLMMALVLPLGQTALSLVMDKLWEDPSSNFRPQARPRSKSKNRSRSRSKGNARKTRSRPRPVKGDYQSWEAAKKGGNAGSKFGGWDELDQEVVSSNSFADEQKQKVDTPPRGYSETDKLSRTLDRDKPLFIRLLIAVFPILGSWTRFLF